MANRADNFPNDPLAVGAVLESIRRQNPGAPQPTPPSRSPAADGGSDFWPESEWGQAAMLAALGLGVGKSIQTGSAAPLASGVVGFLEGRQQRGEREAEAEQQAIENEMARREFAQRQAELRAANAARVSMGPNGPEISARLTDEYTTDVFGFPSQFDRDLETLGYAFTNVPVLPETRQIGRSGGRIATVDAKTGDVTGTQEFAPAAYDASTDPVLQRKIATEGLEDAGVLSGDGGSDDGPVQETGVSGARRVADIMAKQGADADTIYDLLSQNPNFSRELTIPQLREVATNAVADSTKDTPGALTPEQIQRFQQNPELLERANRAREAMGLPPIELPTATPR